MTSALDVPTVVVALAVLVVAALTVATVLLAASLRRTRAETRAVLAKAAEDAAADAEALRGQLDELDQQLRDQAARLEEAARVPAVTVVDDREYVISRLGERRVATGARGALPLPTVPGQPVVDALLRESLIRTASLAAGVRRALAPEVRNRVRFEMRREVKRSRKERRLRLRLARRELHARQRAEMAGRDLA